MMFVRKAGDRFHTDLGWLDSHHTFSFGEHDHPEWRGFRALRVINDDRVARGGGFGAHGHRDMEIISYVLAGALAHKDSMGTGSVIRPGDVQRMTAGTGVMHSEMNAGDGVTHFLQIWIVPDRRGHAPSYEQKRVPDEAKRGALALIASGRTRDPARLTNAVSIHQDADVYATLLSKGQKVEASIPADRFAWVHVVKGEVSVNGTPMSAGDGAALAEVTSIVLEGGSDDGEALLFDLA